MKRLVVLTLLLLPLAWPARASVLGDAAAALAPGQWTRIANSPGCASLFQGSEVGKGIIEYSQELVYDSTTDRVYFAGTADPHAGGADGKFVYYDIATNACAEVGDPPWIGGINHTYDYHWISVPDRIIGWSHASSNNQITHHRYNLATGSWSDSTSTGLCDYTRRGTIASEYFPERGKVVTVCCSQGDVIEYSPAQNSWAQRANNTARCGDLHPHLEYSTDGYVIFGGGDGGSNTTSFWKMDAAGVVSDMPDPPSACHNGGVSQRPGSQGALLVGDPVSGDILLMTDGKFCAFNGTSWTTGLSTSNPYHTSAVNGGGNSGISWLAGAVPLDTYGVVAVFKYHDSPVGHSIYLYRHAAPDTSPTPPPVPTGVRLSRLAGPLGGATAN